MSIYKTKNQIKKIIVFVICIIIGLNTTIGFSGLGSSANKHFVRFGMDKVYAENPWEYFDAAYGSSGGFSGYENYDFSKYNYRIVVSVISGSTLNRWVKVHSWTNDIYFEGYEFSSGFTTPLNIPFAQAAISVQYSNATVERQLKNQSPTITVTTPSPNGTFSEGDTGFIPTVTVSDPDNNTLTSKYYIDSETIARETKSVSNTSAAQTVSFSPFNMGTLTEGSHTIKFEVSDGIATPVTQTVSLKVDKYAPALGAVTVTSSTNSITMSGSATDSIAGLDPYPYRYTVSTQTPTSWLTATSYTQSTLIPNTQYTATFEARDAKGHIASIPQNIYTKAEVPAAMVNNPTSYTLDVSMTDNNPSATQYQIIVNTNKYVTPEGTLTSSPVWITPIGKKVTVKGLSPETTYTFQVKAKNGDGVETTLSSSVSGTTLIAPPGSPINIIATATDNSVRVSWDAVATATGYEVEADGSIVNVGTGTAYTHTGLYPATPHIYRIRGINEGGPGNWSAAISKSTLPSAPGIPLNLSAIPLSTSVTVTWDNVPGATGYDIEVDGTLVNNGQNTNYRHTSLTPGTSHTYMVRSINAGDKSGWSNPVTVTTLVESTPVPVT
ncbi:MAG: fibronectin type III domain-containing protein [Clostridia bacterium]